MKFTIWLNLPKATPRPIYTGRTQSDCEAVLKDIRAGQTPAPTNGDYTIGVAK